MTSLTLTIAALIGMVVRLATMREVRAAHIVLGMVEIDTSPNPPYIQHIHRYRDNTEICNQYFYSRLVIRVSFWVCVIATIIALLMGLLGVGLGNAQKEPGAISTTHKPIEGALDDVAWPALAQSPDGQAVAYVPIEPDGRYLAVISRGSIQTVSELSSNQDTLVVFGADGELHIIGGAIRAIQLLLFIGVIAGLICWLVAGKIKAVEDAMKSKQNKPEDKVG